MGDGTEMEVGDTVLVMPGFGENYAMQLRTPEVGDTVFLYPIGTDIQIAVPALAFEVGDYLFTSPEFNFAGFNFNLDFNFNLVPLNIWFMLFKDHDFKISFKYGGINRGTYYGDSELSPSGGCQKITDSPQNGTIEYAFTDGSFENYPYPDDVSVCVAPAQTGIEYWVMAAPNTDYGADATAYIYFWDQLVWSGALNAAIGNPGYIFAHGIWSP